MTNFVISCGEPSGSATRVFVIWLVR